MKEDMIEELCTEEWCLHFGGKHMDEKEYQAVVLTNEKNEVLFNRCIGFTRWQG